MPWKLEDIALVFITCPRDPAYISATLASAFIADVGIYRFKDIVVAVDAPDLSCVDWLHRHRKIRWVARTTSESEQIAGFSLHRKGCFSYWRALSLVGQDARGIIVCEDDLTFRDGWTVKLLESLNELERDQIAAFLLTAYSASNHEKAYLRRGKYYSSYLAFEFYGTQMMFFPTGEVQPIRKLIWDNGVEAYSEPYDLLIKRRAIERQHLYTTRHSLVQHIGRRSTGLGDGRHQSPSFDSQWPESTSADDSLTTGTRTSVEERPNNPDGHR